MPDFIANAGTVICAVVELHGGVEAAAFPTIEEKIRCNTRLTLERAREMRAPPQPAAAALALAHALNRVSHAIRIGRFWRDERAPLF